MYARSVLPRFLCKQQIIADLVNIARAHGYYHVVGLRVVLDICRDFGKAVHALGVWDKLGKVGGAYVEDVLFACRIDFCADNLVAVGKGRREVAQKRLGARVCMRLENADNSAFCDFFGSAERCAYLVGVVRIVVYYKRAAGQCAYSLKSALYARKFAQTFLYSLYINSADVRRKCRRNGV